jgi:MoxR-like ATPase
LATTAAPSELDRLDDAQLADRLHDAAGRITGEIQKIIVGQESVVEQALVALFAGGNCLLIGVPGLAKRCSCTRCRARSASSSRAFNSRRT